MKKILNLLLILVIFSSCTKDTDTPDNNNSASGSIEYKINGSQVKIVGSDPNVFPMGVLSGAHYNMPGVLMGYMFSATYAVSPATINEKSKSVIISIGIDSLVTGKEYKMLNNPMQLSLSEGLHYYTADTDFDNTTFSITITKHDKSLISGIFSAKMARYDSNGNILFVDITDGKFTDIKMVY